VVMFLDYAEDQARRRKQVFLQGWKTKLDEFLQFHEREVLPDAGKVTRKEADLKASKDYEEFTQQRRLALEAQAEEDQIHELESLARRLGKKGPSREDKK
jgi:hypothetical protein